MYEFQNIIIDMVAVKLIAIILLMIFGLLSVGSVLGVVGVGATVTGFRLWHEKRNWKKVQKEYAEWKWDLLHPEMKISTKDRK